MAAYFKAITATNQIKIGQGKLKGIFCTAASSTPTITVYDSGAASTSDPAVLLVFTPVAGTSYQITGDGGGVMLSKGLYVVISGTVSATFFYE